METDKTDNDDEFLEDCGKTHYPICFMKWERIKNERT